MARPQATVLLDKTITQGLKFEILAADTMYIVLYKQEPFNFKKSYWSITGTTFKYHKVAFPNSAPAYNLADKLNTEFNCSDFSVRQVQ